MSLYTQVQIIFLHLNLKGSALLAANFIKFIRGKDVQPHYYSQRIKDFHLPPQQLHY